MKQKNEKRLPSLAARIPAAFCAFLLTACLLAAAFSLIGLQAMTSVDLHTGVALSEDSMNLQMKRIREGIQNLAERYGFDAENAAGAVSRESVEDFDREVVRWWTGFAGTGRLDSEPVYDTAPAEEALRKDEKFISGLEEMMVKSTVEEISGGIRETVRKSAVLFRDLLLETGARLAGTRINLPQAAELLQKIPLLAGVGCLVLSGCIALLMSRRILTAGQYLGGAMAAAGLLMILILLLLSALNLRGMIAEASQALEAQYAGLSGILRWEMIGGAALMLAAGCGLMLLARKEYPKA